MTVYDIYNNLGTGDFTVTVRDTIAPTWDTIPTGLTLEYGVSLIYQLEASDHSGVANWEVDDVTNFAIDSSGLLTSIVDLETGEYIVEITAKDPYDNTLSTALTVIVGEAPPNIDYTLYIATTIGIGAVAVAIIIIFLKKRE